MISDKKYSLDENLVDQDGVSWSELGMWFWCTILGGCGCGTSDTLAKEAIEVLKFCADRDKIETLADKPDHWEIYLHWMDGLGLLEHGSSVFGSWLTDKGEEILAIIEAREWDYFEN